MGLNEKIIKINDLITDHILSYVKGKQSVLVDLSGGHDTRVNLSILLKHDISFITHSYELTKCDLKISGAIADKYCLKRIVHAHGYDDVVKSLVDACDVRIHGGGYSEVMCVMHKMNRSYNVVKNTVGKCKNDGKFFSPALEPDVIDAVLDIPLCYLLGGVIQKKLIGLNYPELLKFPFTFYDWRHYLLNRYYIYFANFLLNSYRIGNGRNLNENKKIKNLA